ncbi:MAG: 1-deoxy-D-xylulose-5-phosphate synthase [Elusimicrobiaceae bacterium]|nr:1-deoxy-D-xylulose-5-phosphate synthase [Elusimicrobiaceae bacterium]
MELLDKINSPKDLKKLKKEQLPELCQEIRNFIIETISHTGGHLASSLGAVDFIVALHYVFNTPEDKLVFDTGHQAYAHKILTGRKEGFKTIRKQKGLSGFLKIYESEYDTFGAGHASTALSAALGMACARDQKKEKNKVVAIVADGSMTGGMAYEALQNAGLLKTNLLVVLNDNQMFISKRVGALGSFLAKLLSAKYTQALEDTIETKIGDTDIGKNVMKLAKRAKSILFSGVLFAEMGFKYFGPIDGNDVMALVDTLEQIKDIKGPVFLHIVTKKGKGYPPAEAKPTKYHGLGIFDAETGEVIGKSDKITYTKAFSDALMKLAKEDKKITAITAAMPEGTGLAPFRETFPERFYDVGIAEEHAATFAGGLATQGLKPLVALYSSFSQRCYDQIQQDICLQNLPVVFAFDRAGVVGEDGPTHHGVFDLSLFRNIPNIYIAAPADENELQHLLKTAFEANAPFILRYPRGSAVGVKMDTELKKLPLGKAKWLKKGKDATILAVGNMVHPSLEAAELLAKKGIDCGVLNMRFIKPLDTKAIKEALALNPNLITIEDNVLAGGFGSAISEFITDNNCQASLLRLGIGDSFVEHAKQSELHEELGLEPKQIASSISKFLNKRKK